eukprot:7408377-Lingulodinium_polyedra.AAC.1
MQWRMPESSLHVCWWVTNADDSTNEPVKLLAKSLAVLRAALHRLRVATMSTVAAELQRRS